MNKCESCVRAIKKLCSREPEMTLPAEYQQVEYLESRYTASFNATKGGNRQYLVTGINYFADFEIDAQLTNSSYGGKICGVTQNSCLQIVSSSNPYFSCWNSSSNYYMTNANIYTRHKVAWKDNKIYVDNEFVANYTKQTVSKPFILFGVATKFGNATYYMSWPYVRIYSCKLWDSNGTLVRDFIPCYRKSDSVAGMFDTVNDSFYTVTGVKTFIVGSDV